jgi:hypothetical protein
MKSTLLKAKSATKSVVAERDRAQGDLKSKTAVLDKLNSQVKSLVSGLGRLLKLMRVTMTLRLSA